MSDMTPQRHATWFELFFDLIFVVAIAKAAHVLQHAHHGHLSFESYAKYILIMVPIWWCWVGTTMYLNRFDTDSPVQRLMGLGQMLAIIVLAAHINVDFDSYYHGFMYAYVAIRLLTVAMYAKAWLTELDKRSVSGFLATTFTIGAMISLSSIFFDGMPRYVVLYFGIGFDIAAPLFAKKRLSAVPAHAHHMPERFGLLTIILLGESVLSLTNSFDDIDLGSQATVLAVCGFVLAASLWWIYFDHVERRIVGHDLGHGHGIIYSHLLIYIGLGGLAAMIKYAVVPDLGLVDYKVLAAFGVFTFMLAMQALHYIYHPEDKRRHLIRNSLLLDGALAACIVFMPSVPAVIMGVTSLLVLYTVYDYLIGSREPTEC